LRTTVEGRIVRKVQGENTTIKIELVNYQTVDLICNSESIEEIPEPQDWIQAEYDSQTNIVSHIKQIQEPEFRKVANMRMSFVKHTPVTMFFTCLGMVLIILTDFFIDVQFHMFLILFGVLLIVQGIIWYVSNKEW
jgi:hypothetical protein